MKKNGEIMEDKFGIRLVDPKKFVKCEVVRLNKTYGFVKILTLTRKFLLWASTSKAQCHTISSL